jgi:5'-deoxynucleotidase YfbR-like HD superfamily hydrolase
MKDILTYIDDEILEEAKRIFVAYGMKHTIRYGTKRDEGVHAESDAEHVFGLIYLAHYFLECEPVCKDLDRQRVFDILLYHDFGEIKHGDAVTYYKSQEHIDREKAAAKEIFTSLPEPLNEKGYACWKEYEEHTTPEAKFCYALDKVEPLFELMDPVSASSMHRLKITMDMNMSNKVTAAKEYPVMMRFVDVLSKDMRDRGIFWKESTI